MSRHTDNGARVRSESIAQTLWRMADYDRDPWWSKLCWLTDERISRLGLSTVSEPAKKPRKSRKK